MKRGERTPESVKRRKNLQRKVKRYQELREELQLAGKLPVEPAGAVRDERVDPTTQGDQSLPGLVSQALRQGWAVPEAKKPQLVDEMVAIIEDPEEKTKTKVAAFNALRQADQHQHERDNPNAGDKSKGGAQININVVTVEKPQAAVEADQGLIEVQVVGTGDKQDRQGLPEAAAVPPE